MKHISSIIVLFIGFLPFCRSESWDSERMCTEINTDRYSYVSGDVVFLKLYGFINGTSLTDQAVYVDLVTNKESFITGEILHMLEGTASGYFVIPDSLVSGQYFIRVYSEQTKNLTNPFWNKKLIHISNRFGKVKTVDDYDDKLEPDTPDIINDSIALCDIHLNKDTFGTRSKVDVQLKLHKRINTEKIWASLTVKPVSPIEKRYSSLNSNLPSTLQSLNKSLELINQGVMLKGRVKQTNNADSISHMVVFLSIKDSILRFYYSYPDKQGNFSFHLNNYSGYQSLYLSAFEHPSLQPLKNVQFEIDNNFIISNNNEIPQHEKLQHQTHIDTLNVLKSIINKAFQNSIAQFDIESKRDTVIWAHKYIADVFTDVVYMDDFIYLPDFTEIAKEILPFVRYKNNKDGAKIMVIDDEKITVIRKNPLVFIDGVPLVEIEKINDWGTSKIQRVEVKSQPRIYGDLFFKNGFVFIWTVNHDFWDIVSSDYIFNYNMQCYQNMLTYNYPDYSVTEEKNVPDYRQTIYWNPNIEVDNNTPMDIDFYTSDEKGDFEILLQGISSEGKQIRISKIITVE